MEAISRKEKYLSAIAGEEELPKDMKPITREEKFLNQILEQKGIVHFVAGNPNTSDMDFSKAVELHNKGVPLIAHVTAGNQQAVSNQYIYNGNMFVFGIGIAGLVQGTVTWLPNDIQINIGD